MMRAILVLALTVAAVVLTGCTDEIGSRHALRSAGFTDIALGGFAAFACGRDDNFSTKFTAKNPAGNVVSGVVCCGTWKNCTIRF